MKTVKILIKRNTKLFFKDKGLFFTALITPVILLVLYVTFLGDIYRDSFIMNLPADLANAEKLIDACVGGQLISSMLAVSCVTIAFCSNMLMVQDKANRTLKDLTISPVRPSQLAIGYYCATLVSTLIICFAATFACLVYMAIVGWYMSALDVILLVLDVFMLVMFGTALSSIVNFFLSTLGQISAVGTIVSTGYGYICGAYMPISQFADGLQVVISFLPGTYGTALLKNHAMRGALSEIKNAGLTDEAFEALKDAIDCNLYFFDTKVPLGTMYIILGTTVALLLGIYILMNVISIKKRKG